MLEPEELVEDLIAFFQPKPLAGKRVLITAGPTFEAIDPVRGITNLSSGKMGFSIARAAREAGADVLLVAGPTALDTPRGVTRTDVRSAQQMHDAVMAQLRDVDVFVAVAAVADWRPAEVAQQKLKKANDTDTPTLQFVQNPDILAAVAARADAPIASALRPRARTWSNTASRSASARACRCWSAISAIARSVSTTTRSCCSTPTA
jgi:phosphopantothenoylcysteine decarboxylase/phosphopantothenate--cysteine ligase